MATKMVLPGMDMMKGVGIGPLNIGNVLDTMGFVKKAWGAMNAPSSFMPTMDVEELKKRIVDLQAVEQWLMMNLSMIQGSIQALEVQRATIETLKGFVPGNLAATFPGMNLPPEVQKSGPPPQLPPGYYFSPPPAAPAPVFQAPVEAPAMVPPPPPVSDTAGRSKSNTARKGRAGHNRGAGNAAPAKDPGLSATAWLEFLQSQFNQVTQAAMSGATLTSAAKNVAGSVAKSAVKAGARAGKQAASFGATKAAAKIAPRKAPVKTSAKSPAKSGQSVKARTKS